jgi:hypothetical protein
MRITLCFQFRQHLNLNNFTMRKAKFILLVVVFFSMMQESLFSQNCPGNQITISIQNIAVTLSGNAIEYDVYVKNTGTSTLKLAGFAGNIIYSTNFLPAGATGSLTVITQPSATGNFPNFNTITPSHLASSRYLRWTNTSVSNALAVNLPANIGMKFARFRFTSSMPFNINSLLSLNFNTHLTTAINVLTIFCNGNPINYPIRLSLGNLIQIQSELYWCFPTSSITSLGLKLFVEGYMNGESQMISGKSNQGVSYVDDVTVELKDVATLQTVASASSKLFSDGFATFTFPPTVNGSYYLAVKGSNSIQTFSSSAVTVTSNTPLFYDFSTNASNAFGSNMKQISSGVWALISGDINSDGNVDNADFSSWETDANEFAFGIYVTDLNGDGNVDNADFSIWEANANNFVFSVSPTP